MIDSHMLTRAVVLVDGFDPRAVLPATGPHPAFRQVNGVPAVDALVHHLAQQGMEDVRLISRTLPGMVVHYFGNGSGWGVTVTHVRQDGAPGSGGALMSVQDQITESTLIIDGALSTNLQFTALFEAHRSADKDLTMCLSDDLQETAGLPRAHLDEPDGLVQELLTEPPFPASPEFLYGVGVYIAEPEAVKPLQAAGVNADWVADVLPILAAQHRILGWQAEPGTRFDLPRRVRMMHAQAGRATPTI